MENITIQLLAFLLHADCRWTACELVAEVEVCNKTVFHILHDILYYCKVVYPMGGSPDELSEELVT